jgi:hypothetical protein
MTHLLFKLLNTHHGLESNMLYRYYIQREPKKYKSINSLQDINKKQKMVGS